MSDLDFSFGLAIKKIVFLSNRSTICSFSFTSVVLFVVSITSLLSSWVFFGVVVVNWSSGFSSTIRGLFSLLLVSVGVIFSPVISLQLWS